MYFIFLKRNHTVNDYTAISPNSFYPLKKLQYTMVRAMPKPEHRTLTRVQIKLDSGILLNTKQDSASAFVAHF
jgi:hypothetical protein